MWGRHSHHWVTRPRQSGQVGNLYIKRIKPASGIGELRNWGILKIAGNSNKLWVNSQLEIPNPKHQITNKSQIPIFNDPNLFGILFFEMMLGFWISNFGHWDLFVIWVLWFVISVNFRFPAPLGLALCSMLFPICNLKSEIWNPFLPSYLLHLQAQITLLRLGVFRIQIENLLIRF